MMSRIRLGSLVLAVAALGASASGCGSEDEDELAEQRPLFDYAPTRIRHHTQGVVQVTDELSYDAEGRLIGFVSTETAANGAVVSTVYTYGATGRLELKETDQEVDGKLQSTEVERYERDEDGGIIGIERELTDLLETPPVVSTYVTTVERDDKGRPARGTDGSGRSLEWTYNGTTGRIREFKIDGTTYSFISDGSGWLAKYMGIANAPNAFPMISTYTYDLDGNLLFACGGGATCNADNASRSYVHTENDAGQRARTEVFGDRGLEVEYEYSAEGNSLGFQQGLDPAMYRLRDFYHRGEYDRFTEVGE